MLDFIKIRILFVKDFAKKMKGQIIAEHTIQNTFI